MHYNDVKAFVYNSRVYFIDNAYRIRPLDWEVVIEKVTDSMSIEEMCALTVDDIFKKSEELNNQMVLSNWKNQIIKELSIEEFEASRFTDIPRLSFTESPLYRHSSSVLTPYEIPGTEFYKVTIGSKLYMLGPVEFMRRKIKGILLGRCYATLDEYTESIEDTIEEIGEGSLNEAGYYVIHN